MNETKPPEMSVIMGSGETMKLGLIGCGSVAEARHLPALRSLPDVEVVAVAEINPDRLAWIADRFQIEQRYTDYRALLDRSEIEAVAVCTPARFHADVAVDVLDAAKHVFIEKPLALDLDDCARLINRAAKSSCKSMVGFNLRFHRLVVEARDIAYGGDLGRLQMVRSVVTSRVYEREPDWRKRRGLGGGMLIEVAVHIFDLWRFLLATEIKEVFAISRSDRRDDETATLTARMTNGVLATAALAMDTADTNVTELYGQAGRLRLSCYRFDGLEVLASHTYPGSIRDRLRRTGRLLGGLPAAVSKLRRGGDFVESYRAEWRHFIDCIKYDRPVACTLEDGRQSLQIALAAAESVTSGRPVKPTEAPRTIMSRTQLARGSTP